MIFRLKITLEAKSQIKIIMDDTSKEGLQKQLKKAFGFLSQNPRHPSLNSHPFKGAEEVYGVKVWTSYVQNNTPQAYRILWAYGDPQEIVILQVIPHY